MALGLIVILAGPPEAAAVDITLAWDPSPDPTVTGYMLYYGGASATYTNTISAGLATSVVVPNVQPGGRYYFAATSLNLAGMESAFSAEVSYAVPQSVNAPPTLAALNNVTINENAGAQTVALSGISSGSSNEIQTLTVTATSANTSVIPNPTVSYTSPAATGSLSFTPLPNASGNATITVTVNDGGASNNIVTRSFTVTVNPVNQPPTLDPLSNIAINENAGAQTVNLSGITSGATNEIQTLTVTAFSGNPSLIPNPTVTYTSPQPTGSISFAPVSDSYGSVVITVMVDDGGSVSNTVIRSFTVTVTATNAPPTLGALTNLVILENSGMQTVNLSGISSGAPNEAQFLTLTAASSNPSVIPDPAVIYLSPASTGTLTFTPASNAVGSATITVTVDDGQPTNNTTSQAFTVTVNPTVFAPNALTNVSIPPNGYFRFPLYPPFTNHDHITYSLDPSAPAGALIAPNRRNSGPALVWSPTLAQASTTNYITIRVNDNNNPMLSTNEMVVVIVQDYMSIWPGNISLQAGQNGVLPLYLACSEGVTNFSFSLTWLTNLFLNPSLFVAVPGVATNSMQAGTTNLLLSFQMAAGQSLRGSNLIAQLSFQTAPGQPSAFLPVPVQILSAAKPTGAGYLNYMPQPGQVTVVNNLPLLAAGIATNGNQSLTCFGKVGASYQLQYTTNMAPATWYPLFTYSQTNVSQILNTGQSGNLIFYRLQQQ